MKLIVYSLVFCIGISVGAYLFTDTLPRNLLPYQQCKSNCFSEKQLAGLITSVLLLKVPSLIPTKVMESDTCVAIRHPYPKSRIHFVLFPKHDTKNIATLTTKDSPYVFGCFAMIRQLVLNNKLNHYYVRTNGPGPQEIAYLHFHLISK